MPSQQGLQPWGPHGLRPSNSSLSLLISQALFPLYTNSSFRKGQEHLNQPPLVSASPFPSSLPNYYQLTVGFSSVLCLLKLSMSLFHGAWVWGGNHLLHCPSRRYRRFQTSLSSPVLYAQHERDACLILECPLKKKQTHNLFKHLLPWSNKHIFCRGRERIRKVTIFQVVLLDLSLTKRKSRHV